MVFIEGYLVLWIISNVMPKCVAVGSELFRSAAELFRPVEPYRTGEVVKPTAVACTAVSVVPLVLV